jgi:hypothetical protein
LAYRTQPQTVAILLRQVLYRSERGLRSFVRLVRRAAQRERDQLTTSGSSNTSRATEGLRRRSSRCPGPGWWQPAQVIHSDRRRHQRRISIHAHPGLSG